MMPLPSAICTIWPLIPRFGVRVRGWGKHSIRVPDEKFDQAMAELRKLAVRVERESTTSQDVTEQYTDLQARLNNAKATEKQYLALLDKAATVEDMLSIQDSLSRVRTEIEQIQGSDAVSGADLFKRAITASCIGQQQL